MEQKTRLITSGPRVINGLEQASARGQKGSSDVLADVPLNDFSIVWRDLHFLKSVFCSIANQTKTHLSLHSLGAKEGADLRLGHIDPGHDRPVIWTTLQVRGTGEDILPGARGRRLGVALPFVAQCDAGGS